MYKPCIKPCINLVLNLVLNLIKKPYQKNIKTLSKKLEDDPADHRGVLSWHNQLKDKKLREAGTYGEKIEVPLSKSMLKKALQKGYINIKISADQGVAVYGSQFGRYPINPSICTWYN